MSIAPTPPPGRVKKPALKEPESKYHVFGIGLGGDKPPVVTVTELEYSGDPDVPFLFSGTIGRIDVTENRSDTLIDPETLAANKPLLEVVRNLLGEIRTAHENEPRKKEKDKLGGTITHLSTLLTYVATRL